MPSPAARALPRDLVRALAAQEVTGNRHDATLETIGEMPSVVGGLLSRRYSVARTL